MGVIVVDEATRAQLLAADGVTELRAADGSLLGLLVPGSEPLPTGYIDPDMTEEEIQKRLAPDAKTYTTAEVLAYLRSLA